MTVLSTHQFEVLNQFNCWLSLLRGCAVIALEHTLEGPLCPLIVDGVASPYLTLPIETEANLVQLRAIMVDVLDGCFFWMLSSLDGILLSRQTIGIVSHGVQHVEALLTLIAGIDITGDIAQRMTYVQASSTRIREHVQHVELLLRLVLHHTIGAILYPSLLPFLFDVSKIVIHCIFVFNCFCT